MVKTNKFARHLWKLLLWLAIVFVLLEIVFCMVWSWYFSENGKVKEGMVSGAPMSMNVTIKNLYLKVSNPNPNGNYTAHVSAGSENAQLTFGQTVNIPIFMSKSIQQNGNVVTLTVEPSHTATPKLHYADVFPPQFNIDVLFDASFVPFGYYNATPGNASNRVSITNGILNANQVGTIVDGSQNVCGYIKEDVYIPNHFFVTVNSPIDISSVIFTWKMGDLSGQSLPPEFSNKEAAVLPVVTQSSNTYSGNTYSGNTTLKTK